MTRYDKLLERLATDRPDLPPHREFISLPMAAGDRVVSLNFGESATITYRSVDADEVEDIYVLETDSGQTLAVPEGDLRLLVEDRDV